MLERILLGFLFITISHHAIAQVATRFVYSEAFSMAEGLEHSVIGDFCADQNDLLWIAVNGTLQLFDGDKFVGMGHLIHKSNTRGVFGFESGRDVFLLKQNILYKFTTAQYTSLEAPKRVLPTYSKHENHPNIIYEDGVYLYIAHPNDSLYQIEKKSMILKRSFEFFHKPHSSFQWSSVYINAEPVSQIHYIDTDSLKCSFDLISEKTTIDVTRPRVSIGAFAGGDTLIVLQPNNLEISTDTSTFIIPLPMSGLEFKGQQILLVGRDSAYISLNNSIYLFNLRSMSWVSRIQRTGGQPFSGVKLRRMLMDKSGHIFISTFNSGLIKTYPPIEGFQYIGVPSRKEFFIKCIRVSEEKNLILAGTLQDGLLVFDTNGVLKHQIVLCPDSSPLKFVSAILKISPSRFILLAEKAIELIFEADQYHMREIHDFGRDPISYYENPIEDTENQRFLNFNNHRVFEIRPDDSIPFKHISYLYFRQSISVSTCAGGYVMSAGDELIFYNQSFQPNTIKFNLPDLGYSRCVVPYSPSEFLVATDQGLYLLDTLNPTYPYSPIYDHMVYAILPGKLENEFWFSTDYGLYRLNADLTFKQYTIESGIQENEFNTNSCFKTESGKLYFGGINGITAFYPENIDMEMDNPLPYISTFSVNGDVRQRYFTPGKSPTFDLANNENSIQLRLLPIGQRSPKNYNLQYRVKGLHERWINLENSPDIQLQLPPGHYTIYFHVANDFEPDAPLLHALEINIHPPIYRRWWFITIMALIPLYILYYIMNLHRTRLALKLAYKQELGEKLHEERIRISRDLHDNIGAQMATVKRGINFIIHQGDRLTTAETQTKMMDLESISTQINQELRDTIWVVKNEQIDISHFILRLKNFVHQLAGPESHYRISNHSSGNMDTILGPFTALNLHRICQEALNNIFKHAQATEISITFENSNTELKIIITDNGTGYNIDHVKEGYGLGNIRSRAAQIGATVDFNQHQNSGSQVLITYKYQDTSPLNPKSHG